MVDWDDSYSAWLLAGAGVYLAAPIGLTIGYHVPRNDALAGLDPGRLGRRGPLEALRRRMDANEPRAVSRAAIAAAAALIVALMV